MAEYSALEMSDDEFQNQPEPEFEVKEEEVEEVAEAPEEEEVAEAEEEPEQEEATDEPEEQPEETQEEDEGKDPEQGEEAEKSPEEPSQALAPLKAGGRTININSVDELRQLAQMGVDYTKKMQGLAPNLKLMKMLEKNGLLDESKLAHLIDLDKKRPEAINHLVKESGIDPLELNSDEDAPAYVPNKYAVSDKEMALDNVLGELEHTPHFQTTIDVVAKQWDEESRKVVLDNPAILKDINQHMDAGLYEMVANEVERQKLLGHLDGVSDISAYKQVGDLMHKAGAFAGIQQQQAPAQQQQAPLAPLAEKTDATEKKRAAALTKGKKAATKKVTASPLEMSDDEWAKIANISI